MTAAFWTCLFITAASAFISLGFSLAALFTSIGQSRTNAMYAASRSVALAVASLIPFFIQSQVWLLSIGLIMVIVQAIDAVIGAMLHDIQKTLGPLSLAVLNLSALVWLAS